MFKATVHNVMIAAPSDVKEELAVIRSVIDEWNIIYSQRQNHVLLPIHWSTHSIPEMGDAPQAIINRQMLERSDMLIAVFWHRIGSPTERFRSGAVEEIEMHLDAKKPVMVYFSNLSTTDQEVNEDQVLELEAFKNECKLRSLYGSYSDLGHFRDQLRLHLPGKAMMLPGVEASSDVSILGPKTPTLSLEAQKLLFYGTIDRYGTINLFFVLGGYEVTTNGMEFAVEGTPLDRARWREAVSELFLAGYLDGDRVGAPNLVTQAGFAYVERDRVGIRERTASI